MGILFVNLMKAACFESEFCQRCTSYIATKLLKKQSAIGLRAGPTPSYTIGWVSVVSGRSGFKQTEQCFDSATQHTFRLLKKHTLKLKFCPVLVIR